MVSALTTLRFRSDTLLDGSKKLSYDVFPSVQRKDSEKTYKLLSLKDEVKVRGRGRRALTALSLRLLIRSHSVRPLS